MRVDSDSCCSDSCILYDVHMLQRCCDIPRGSAGALKVRSPRCDCMAHQLNMPIQIGMTRSIGRSEAVPASGTCSGNLLQIPERLEGGPTLSITDCV